LIVIWILSNLNNDDKRGHFHFLSPHTMKHLEEGNSARIKCYCEHNSFTERLRELGMTEGSTFTVVRKAPFNGPMHIKCGFCHLMLRPDETQFIDIELV
jgi:Fe2+ transport system protein FeoA